MIASVVMPEGRRVMIDGEGRLHPAEGDLVDIVADQLVAVVVLWRHGDDARWLGWLTTTMRRSVPFCAEDLGDPVVQSWLRALPAWDHDRLWHATTTPGTHMVWRRGQPAAVQSSQR